MPARTQIVFLIILNKPHLCQRGKKMFLTLKCQRWHNPNLNMCWPNAYHAIEDSKWIWTCVDRFCENTNCISTCVCLTPLMPAWSTNVINKGWPIPTLKPQLNMSCQNHHVFTMPSRKQNASQLMSTNSSHVCVDTRSVSTSVDPCQPGQNMYLNLCWPSHSRDVFHNMSSQASGETKCISTCTDQTPPLPARTQNAFQHLLSKPLLFERLHIMYLDFSWPYPHFDTVVPKYCVITLYLNGRPY